MAKIRVLLVDDHAVVREGYHRLLERHADLEVVGEAASAADAYHEFSSLKPDVVVMDISLPGVSGIEATRRILAREPEARVLMFSIHEETIFATRAMEAGARGYLTKASAPEALVEAVRAVAAGRRYLSHDIAQALALQSPTAASTLTQTLTLREFEVLRLLAQGYGVKEAGERLGLTSKTVSNHQSAIKQKLGAENAAQLVRIAIRLGVLGETEQSRSED